MITLWRDFRRTMLQKNILSQASEIMRRQHRELHGQQCTRCGGAHPLSRCPWPL